MTLARKLAVVMAAMMLIGGFGAIAASGADVVVHDQNVTITEDTDSVWIEVNNTNTSQQANLTATITGIDVDGNETTTLETITINTAADSTSIDETSVTFNESETPEANVLVELDNTTVSESEVSVTSGTFEQTDGTAGGGFDLGGLSTTEQGVIVAVVIGVAYLFMKEE